MNEKNYYLNKLNEVLQSENIPLLYYNFDGYAEECVCLESLTNSYLVYTGERGNKYTPREHENIISACCDIISRLSDSVSQNRRLTDKFLSD